MKSHHDATYRYNHSEIGRMRRKRYKQSFKGKQARKRYDQSPKGRRAAQRRRATPKYKRNAKRYQQTSEYKQRQRNRALKRKYAITSEQVHMLIRQQRGRCAICRCRLTRPQIDHNHKTGHVRAILCWPCNILLGVARDSCKTLQAAATYLRQHGN